MMRGPIGQNLNSKAALLACQRDIAGPAARHALIVQRTQMALLGMVQFGIDGAGFQNLISGSTCLPSPSSVLAMVLFKNRSFRAGIKTLTRLVMLPHLPRLEIRLRFGPCQIAHMPVCPVPKSA